MSLLSARDNLRNSLNLSCGKTTDLVKSFAVNPTTCATFSFTSTTLSAKTFWVLSFNTSINLALEVFVPVLLLAMVLSTMYLLLVFLLPISNSYDIIALSHTLFIYSFVFLDIFPYIAIVIASNIVDFPLPVVPNIPNKPLSINFSKSITCLSI